MDGITNSMDMSLGGLRELVMPPSCHFVMTREENMPLLCSVLCEDLRAVWTSLVAQMVKNPPVMQETWVRSLSCEDPNILV